ncbi:DUF1015 family protein [Pedobacter sp.]|uniref:DUF1015 family protein n=1 Tax=Pedobacter sp. TaxID=1411316 RepID=UPI003BA9ECA9
MATIAALNALKPQVEWFDSLMTKSSPKLSALKYILEGRGENGIGTGDIKLVESELVKLVMDNKYLKEPSETMYVYEQQSALGKQYGLWTMTSAEDFLKGKILGHEQTRLDREIRISDYRASVGLEGSPVLLTYQQNTLIDAFLLKIINSRQPICYREDLKSHKFWQISNQQELDEIIDLFSKINNVYIGDGHHRLTSASKMQAESPQWVMSLYVSTSQLNISTFTRLVLPDREFNVDILIGCLGRIFYISPVPSNIPYVPDRQHRFGLLIDGTWFQLDLKPECYELSKMPDVSFLQKAVLDPLLGIKDPKTDHRLHSLPLNKLEQTIIDANQHKNAVLFTVYPISVHKLIEQAEMEICLPPKSSFIEPKVPYGLLLSLGPILKHLKSDS